MLGDGQVCVGEVDAATDWELSMHSPDDLCLG